MTTFQSRCSEACYAAQFTHHHRVFSTPLAKQQRLYPARILLMGSSCYSVNAGQNHNIHFDRAALFWASFYHVMFRENESVMNRETMRRHGREAARLFQVDMRLFTKENGHVRLKRLH